MNADTRRPLPRAVMAALLLMGPVLATGPWTAAPRAAEAEAAPEQATAYFIEPRDGDRVGSPVVVRFGLRGMGVAPAGVQREGTGHHHLLINVDDIDLEMPIPTDERHRHFGGGQTETLLELPPGRHSLQLLLGDFAHRPHSEPVMSEKIEVEVVAPQP